MNSDKTWFKVTLDMRLHGTVRDFVLTVSAQDISHARELALYRGRSAYSQAGFMVRSVELLPEAEQKMLNNQQSLFGQD